MGHHDWIVSWQRMGIYNEFSGDVCQIPHKVCRSRQRRKEQKTPSAVDRYFQWNLPSGKLI